MLTAEQVLGRVVEVLDRPLTKDEAQRLMDALNRDIVVDESSNEYLVTSLLELYQQELTRGRSIDKWMKKHPEFTKLSWRKNMNGYEVRTTCGCTIEIPKEQITPIAGFDIRDALALVNYINEAARRVYETYHNENPPKDSRLVFVEDRLLLNGKPMNPVDIMDRLVNIRGEIT